MDQKPEEKAKEAAEQQTTEEKQKLIRISEISLSLDNYDDIFSDFDPRPYSQRALSDDFLREAKYGSRDKASGKFELRFLIPHDKVNKTYEALIKKRLKDHFTKHAGIIKGEQKSLIRKGIIFCICGAVLMFLATYLLFTNQNPSLFLSFLIVFLEPGGWFFLWEGLNMVIFQPDKKKQDLVFNQKMSKCEVSFISY